MLNLHEMAVMRWIPREPVEALGGVGANKVGTVWGAWDMLHENDKTFDEMVAIKVIDALLSKKLIEKTAIGMLRTREGQKAYAETATVLQQLSNEFVTNSYK